MKYSLVCLLFISLISIPSSSYGLEKTKVKKRVKVKSKKHFLEKNRTSIKNPFDLRDPFKRLISLKKVSDKKKNSFLDGDVFTNLPSIENIPLNDISIVGILFGEKPRAIAKLKGKSKDTFILKEGMKLGEDNAEIKAIFPGGIVVVEKIRNVYNQDEYLETIIPVTSN